MDDPLSGNLTLQRRGLEWFTSHALWELGKYAFFAGSAWLVSFGVSRIIHAALGTALNIFLVLIGLMGMLWVSGAVRWHALARKEGVAWEVFFISPGLSVSLSPSMGRVIINLHILSTRATELIFLHLTLRNNKGTYLDCESSEPMMIEPMQITAKIIDRKFLPQELATFEKGEMVNLDGYAKFRDGASIKQFRISMSTIPSL